MSTVTNLRTILSKINKRMVCSFGTYNIITYWNCSQINTYGSEYGASLFLSRTCRPLIIGGCWFHFLVLFSPAALCHARLVEDSCRVMDLAKRFEEATSFTTVNLTFFGAKYIVSYRPGQEDLQKIRTYRIVNTTNLIDKNHSSVPT